VLASTSCFGSGLVLFVLWYEGRIRYWEVRPICVRIRNYVLDYCWFRLWIDLLVMCDWIVVVVLQIYERKRKLWYCYDDFRVLEICSWYSCMFL